MNRFSVRARLTLWNVSVLAVILITLGLGVRTMVRAYLMAGIDSELTERAERLRDDWTRRFRFEKGEFVFVGRGRRDNTPRRRGPENGPARNEGRPESRPESPRPGPVPSPPPPDVYTPRVLNAAGDPPNYRFFRAPALDKRSVIESRRTKATVLRNILIDQEPYRIVTVRINLETDGRPVPLDLAPAYLQLSFRLTDIERGLQALDYALLTLLPLSLLVSGFGGLWLTGHALRPVREITAATDRIAAESLSGRLPVSGNDEFSELSRRFNSMLERLEAGFERQRRFVADASHELRTPLAIVTVNTSLALDEETAATPQSTQRAFVAIHSAAGRMNRIVGDLLLLAQSDGHQLPREHKDVSIDEVLQTAGESARMAYVERTGQPGAKIQFRESSGIVLHGADLHYLVRIFVNLIENALRYTPADGLVSISVDDSPEFVQVTVADTGIGIAPEHLPRLFDRFYRADDGRDRGRGGTGLGLAIVRTLVDAHGGDVSLRSQPGEGTSVSVVLPKK